MILLLCDESTPAQVKALRLMVNRSVALADWHEDYSLSSCESSTKRSSNLA
jgi:hypothetical protein